MLRSVARLAYLAADILLVVPLALLALLSRRHPRPIDVGLGPLPLVNNIHHKRALLLQGYSAETFVHHLFHITSEFDVRRVWPRPFSYLARIALFVRVLKQYRALYHYFDGGSLGDTPLLRRVEPWLYHLSGIRVVVMPYGSDVHDLTRCPNPRLRAAMAIDYPQQERRHRSIAAQVHRWTRHAHHIISGCDWVDYTPRWDTLTVGHFSIDTRQWSVLPAPPYRTGEPLRILHAPNHRAVKGTPYLLAAVDQLRSQGIPIDLRLLEGVSNEAVREAIREVHLVADQFIIGWYAMFAIEAMASGRPVLCYIRPDLEKRYVDAGILAPDELPIIRADADALPDRLRSIATQPERLAEFALRSRLYVERHHSLDSVGAIFRRINEGIGLSPSGSA